MKGTGSILDGENRRYMDYQGPNRSFSGAQGRGKRANPGPIFDVPAEKASILDCVADDAV